MEPQATVVTGTQSVSFPAEPTPPIAPQPENTTPSGDGAARPEWLPEEFASVEQFVDAYKSLKGGAPPPTEAPEGEGESQDKAEASTESGSDPVVEIVQDAGLDWDDVSGHFAEHGALSDEHYAKFEESGIPRALVDGWLAGQQAIMAQFNAGVVAAAGGEDAFKAAASWAAANLSEAELAPYNEAVNSGDFERAKLAVQGIIARHAKSVGSEPNLADGQGGAASSIGFRSRAEMVAAMQDPRYDRDPAYRSDVERKVAASAF